MIPKELTDKDRWAMSIVVNGELDKAPRMPDGSRAASTREETWSNFYDALGAKGQRRVGYMMGEGEFVVIDLDAPKNATPEDYEDFETRAQHIIKVFDSYTERSASGKGYHIFIRATKDMGARCKDSALGYEVYNHSRYLIVTGDDLPCYPSGIMPRQKELDQFMEAIFPKVQASPKTFVATSSGDIGTIEDVLNIWQFAKNGERALMAYHEPSTGSEDDMRLISHLAFYLPDEEALYDAFRNSPAFREDQIARRGGEDKYKRWCVTQNIRRAIANLEETFDWSEEKKETDEQKRLAEEVLKRYLNRKQ